MDIPLPQLKHQLEELLLDLQHLVTALQRLRDLLPEHSEKRVTVLTLFGRLNDANKKALRGTLDNTALQTEYNAIRADLSDFIQGLEESDFDATKPVNKDANSKTSKNGNVLYRIPHTMPLQEETECVVRIAIDEDAIVEEITLDDQVVLKDLSRVSDLMQVELADPAKKAVFEIRTTSPAQQLITEEGYTEWFFYVAPKETGTHQLEVKVSVLEMALNQIHRKEIVFRETVEILTEAKEEVDTAPKFKQAGQAFAFGDAPPGTGGDPYLAVDKSIGEVYESAGYYPPEAPPAPAPPPPPAPAPARQEPQSKNNKGARTLALFMAFIMLGSTATWALTPAATRDWWVASLIKDDEEAYAAYVEKYPESPYLEKAVYFRAERSERLADLRVYQEKFPDGKFEPQVASRVSKLETASFDSLRAQLSPENIRQFASSYPETERLSILKEAVESREENRNELMAEVEDAYISTARTRPSAKKVTDYLHDFPAQNRLDEVTATVATKPEIMAKVQPALEEAYLKKMEANPTTSKADEFLEKFPEPVKQAEFEQILNKRPAVKRAAQTKMQKIRDARRNGN